MTDDEAPTSTTRQQEGPPARVATSGQVASLAPAERRRTDGATPGRTASRMGWLWGAATVLTAAAAGSVPLLFISDYYWRGDTQIAYFGAYYHLGEALRQGDFPLMEPFAWRGGNHVVEGNFGLLSPIIMIVGIGATLVTNAVVYMTAIKLVFLGIAAGGVYLLTRSYGGPRQVAFVAGVLVPTCGFTLYLDAPTWFPGLIVSGLLPYVWWALRGCLLHGWNPLLALVFGSLLATIGYVFGTVMLAVVISACIIDALIARRPGAALKGVAIGLLIGVPAAVVRLPFVLSSEVTSKGSLGVRNTGTGVTDLSDLVIGTLPTQGITAPLFYVSWLMPFLVFVDWRKARRHSRDLAGVLLVALVALAWALAPSNIGPLRYPIRLMPYVVLCVVLLGAIAFTRARYRHLSSKRLLLALFITAFSAYVSASSLPQYWRVQAIISITVGLGLTALWFLLRYVHVPLPRGSAGIAAAFVGTWTLVIVGVQHHYAPETFAVDRGMPADIGKYSHQFPAAVGDTFMVGHVDAEVEPGSKPKPLILIANSWYVSGRAIQNVHANTGHHAYEVRYCMNYLGFTCPAALLNLLSTEPTTGIARADLLSVNSIVLLKSDIPERISRKPPSGWRLADDSRMSTVWVRDRPVPSAGGVVWHTPGLGLVEEFRDDESVRLRIGEVPADGAEIVLSRIAWPGYQISNATVTDPLDDYLLTLRVSPTAANSEIKIRYEPPHWTFLLRCLAAAVVVGLIWSLVAAAVPRLRRRRSSGAL